MKNHIEVEKPDFQINESEIDRNGLESKRPSVELPYIKKIEEKGTWGSLEKAKESERPIIELPHVKEKNVQKDIEVVCSDDNKFISKKECDSRGKIQDIEVDNKNIKNDNGGNFTGDTQNSKDVVDYIKKEDKVENIESDEQKDLSPEEIDIKQKKAIKEAFERIAKGEKLTDAEKGNLGEMLMDQYYISQGYKPIHKPRVTDLEHKSGQGIDGVYEKTNPDGTKSYNIADAKVNSSRLNKGLADGTDQMSDEWVENRLDNAVGKEKADEIRDAYEDNPKSVSKEVYHFSYGEAENGSSMSETSTVDGDGNMNRDKKTVQVFDKNGNEI